MNPENELPERKNICPTCNGAGKVYRPIRMRAGMVERMLPCYECGGIGEVYKEDGADDAMEHYWEGIREDKA